MALKLIRLELARNKDFPEGSPNHGYEFRAPLAGDGHIDRAGWETESQLCTVWHFWADEADERGQLIRTPGGQWAFSYELGEADDEPIFRFDSHVFKEGEYVTITEHDGEDRVFRVSRVTDPPMPAA